MFRKRIYTINLIIFNVNEKYNNIILDSKQLKKCIDFTTRYVFIF